MATCVESETFEYGEDSVEAAATQLRKDFDSGLSMDTQDIPEAALAALHKVYDLCCQEYE